MKTITEALDLEMIMTTPSDGQLWGADDYENGSFTGKADLGAIFILRKGVLRLF